MWEGIHKMDYIDLSLAFMHERKAQGKSNRIDEEYMRDFKAWKAVGTWSFAAASYSYGS